MSALTKEQFKAKLRQLRDGGCSHASLIVYTRVEVEEEVALRRMDRDNSESPYHAKALKHLNNARDAIDALNEVITETDS